MPGDGRGQREREIDQGIDDALARKVVAHQHPRDEQAEDRVDARRDERGAEAQPVGRHRARARDGRPELVPSSPWPP